MEVLRLGLVDSGLIFVRILGKGGMSSVTKFGFEGWLRIGESGEYVMGYSVVETYFNGRYGEKLGINVGIKVGIGAIFSVDLREFGSFGVVLQLSDNLLVVLVKGYFVGASK